jgi:hypothetical protein
MLQLSLSASNLGDQEYFPKVCSLLLLLHLWLIVLNYASVFSLESIYILVCHVTIE